MNRLNAGFLRRDNSNRVTKLQEASHSIMLTLKHRPVIRYPGAWAERTIGTIGSQMKQCPTFNRGAYRYE
jgi:hypothetical protein